jgi:hypothetical protein
MDNNIAGGISTVLAAVIVWFIDRSFFFDKPVKYENVSRAIREAVDGKWSGIFQQGLNNQQISVPIDLTLKVSRKGVGSPDLRPQELELPIE